MRSRRASLALLSVQLKIILFYTMGNFFPKALSKSAHKIVVKRRPYQPNSKELVYMESASKYFIDVGGQKVRVWSWGQGPTVLFVHGWSGRGTQVVGFIDDLVKSGFNVMSIDLPAHGQSEGEDTNPLDMMQALEVLISEIDNLHTVITHSMGGAVFSSIYLNTMPISRVVMICPQLNHKTIVNYFTMVLKFPKKMQLEFINVMMDVYGKDILDKLSNSEQIKKIELPLLIIHDKLDRVVPFADGLALSKAALGSVFIETNQYGHNGILHSAEVVASVLSFIQDTEIK